MRITASRCVVRIATSRGSEASGADAAIHRSPLRTLSASRSAVVSATRSRRWDGNAAAASTDSRGRRRAEQRRGAGVDHDRRRARVEAAFERRDGASRDCLRRIAPPDRREALGVCRPGATTVRQPPCLGEPCRRPAHARIDRHPDVWTPCACTAVLGACHERVDHQHRARAPRASPAPRHAVRRPVNAPGPRPNARASRSQHTFPPRTAGPGRAGSVRRSMDAPGQSAIHSRDPGRPKCIRSVDVSNASRAVIAARAARSGQGILEDMRRV